MASSATDVRQIPIDIHLGQLLEWLTSRRHCNKEWHANLENIRNKISYVYPQILNDEQIQASIRAAGIPEVPSDLLYTDLKSVLDILTKSEKYSTTNMIGQYQSPITRELSDVIKTLEKDNIYLAEMAQALHRSITYDIPFIRKQMQKLDQTAAESVKKTGDNMKSAQDYRDAYLKECATLGIQGKNVREELLQEAQALPDIYENIAQKIVSLREVCDCVEEFVNGVHKGGKIPDQTGQTLFPLLRHLMEHGNIPYPVVDSAPLESSRTNAAVMNMDLHSRARNASSSSQTSLSVNLNDTIADHLNELGSPSPRPPSRSTSAIEEAIDFEIMEPVEGTPDVNWDIDTNGFEIVVQGGGSNAGGLLDNPEFRTQTVNELHEILAFLRRRADEQSTDHMASDLLNIHVGSSRLMTDRKLTQQLMASVKEIMLLFDDHRLQSLCKLHDNATFLDRLTKQLEQKLVFCDRMEGRAETAKIARMEALAERERLVPELDAVLERAKGVQKFIEKDISKKYQDRRVSILGGIQSVV